MDNELSTQFLEPTHLAKTPVKIEFKKRNSIVGIFVESPGYDELKSKNFWRIVSETNITEWKQSQDNKLAKIFSGAEFNRISLPKQSAVQV